LLTIYDCSKEVHESNLGRIGEDTNLGQILICAIIVNILDLLYRFKVDANGEDTNLGQRIVGNMIGVIIFYLSYIFFVDAFEH
jgi:heme/copper-type cytochrome/quinol oxidase subunit 4